MSVNWAELPPELLETISKKLKVHADYIRFRAVCSAWLAATCQTPSHLPCQLPWLMLPQSHSHHNYHRRYFFRLSDNKYHSLNLPEASHRRRRCGSSHGWLTILDESPSIFLINPLTRSKHNLPPLTAFPNVIDFSFYNIGREYTLRSRDDGDRGGDDGGEVYFCSLIEMRDTFIKKVILSDSPLQNSNFIAIAILNQSGDLAYCKGNRNSWQFIDDARSYCEDVIYSNGLFYAVDKFGSVAVCDLNGDLPKVSIIDTPIPVKGDMQYLVKGKDDELLLIARNLELEVDVGGLHELDIAYKTFEFCVYRMDRRGPVWESLENLGDYVLFLGENSSLALSASEYPGLKGNRIYYTDDYSETNYDGISGDHDLGVYNVEDGSIEALACYPRNLHCRLRWPPPVWITPNPC